VLAGALGKPLALALRHRIVALVAAVALAAGGVTLGLWLTRSSASDPLSGNWKDPAGNLIELHSMGADSWSGWYEASATSTCMPVDISLTGSNGGYRGVYDYYVHSSTAYCSVHRTDRLALAVQADGVARVTATAPTTGCAVCGPDVWTRQRVTAATTADPLTGDWRQADVQHQNPYEYEWYRFTAFGDHVWTMELLNGVLGDFCLPRDIAVTGSNGRYQGEFPYFPSGGGACRPYAGPATVTVVIAPGGTAARITVAAPRGVACSLCGTRPWTKGSFD
jgi:hypothetical protein